VRRMTVALAAVMRASHRAARVTAAPAVALRCLSREVRDRCKRRLFASARIEDLLGPYLSISATSQSTLSPLDEERRCCVIPRYCASRISPRADGQRVGVTFKEHQFPT